MLEWMGYTWMNGQPWGIAHPNKDQQWYADPDETKILSDGSLCLSLNNKEKYIGGDVNQTKKFGCGVITTNEAFLYGHFKFRYILPKGIHLWPGIWLSGVDSWPPEIDIMEGWSGNGFFCKGKPNYKKFIGFNRIHPGIYYGRDGEKALGKGYGSLGTDDVTYEWYQNTNGKQNTCELYWQPDHITAYYNEYKVMDITEEVYLKGLRARMSVRLDLFAGNNMTQKDYNDYKKNGTPFIINEFTYKPL